MAEFKLVVSCMGVTNLPRDRMVNVVHFDSLLPSPDYNALCNDLAVIYDSVIYASPDREVKVTAYSDVGPPPHYPLGEKILHTDVFAANTPNPETALCLSFYAEHNVPRRRGRIYICAGAAGIGLGARPTATDGTKLLDLASSLSGLGGVDIDWVVRSIRDNNGYKVSNAWVDDEWDVQRRRGPKATTRWTRAVSG